MKKDVKKTLIITSIITALPILIGVVLWNRLPDTMATHFGSDGTPNGWSSKWFAVIGLPIFLAVLNVFCIAATENDPRRERYPEKMMKLVQISSARRGLLHYRKSSESMSRQQNGLGVRH